MNFRKIKAMTWADLLKDHEFINAYVRLYNLAHDSQLDLNGEEHFLRETGFLKQIILDNPFIAQATTLSFMATMMDLAYYGLSIQPTSKQQAYVLPRKVSVKNADGTKSEEVRVQLALTAYGEIALRIRSEIIKYVDNPVMVYKGDFYEPKTISGTKQTVIDHIPRFESEEIIHAFVKITRFDDSVDYGTISLDDMMRLKASSDNKTGKPWTGGAGGGPMKGMWVTKLLKHSFNTYPRIKLKDNTVLAPDEPTKADAAYASVMSGFITDEEDDDILASTQPPPATPATDNPTGKSNEPTLPAETGTAPPPPVEIMQDDSQSDIVTYDF